MKCEHVEFTADGPEQCDDDANPEKIGGVSVRLCEEHAAQARQEYRAADSPRGNA